MVGEFTPNPDSTRWERDSNAQFDTARVPDKKPFENSNFKWEARPHSPQAGAAELDLSSDLSSEDYDALLDAEVASLMPSERSVVSAQSIVYLSTRYKRRLRQVKLEAVEPSGVCDQLLLHC